MNKPFRSRAALAARALLALAALAVAPVGCGGGSATSPTAFAIEVPAEAPRLVEGDDGVSVPVTVRRTAGHDAPLTLSIEAASPADAADLHVAPAELTLPAGTGQATFTLRLDIADAPIGAGQRRFVVRASDGSNASATPITLDVEPVDAPDVYLLIGQSNMIGSSGAGTRRAAPGEPDAPDPRIRQLNVAANDPNGAFADPEGYRSPEKNVVAPTLVRAEDPLHEPLPDNSAGKGPGSVGLGLSFAKRALAHTTREIVLVPAAWSGSAFCASEGGPRGQWNAEPDTHPALGNTLLFERALLRVDAALAESGGILRGILWHQGESDANDACAPLYADNLDRLARELRRRIRPDRRGPSLRAPDAPIPFVVGTLSRGVDERGDFSDPYPAKRTVDAAHRAIGERVPHAAVVVNDDLVPANGYPCGTQDCIHFGAEALREMGARYHAALLRALAR